MLEVRFFKTGSGNEPTLDWLRSLPLQERRIVGADLRTLQIGWPMGMPLCRKLGSGLYELRSALPNRIARLIFFQEGNSLIIVEGFIKKSQKTPKTELDTARRRMKEHQANSR